MIKVVFCTDGIFPEAVGGMQRHSRLLIEELARSGEVDLVVIHPHPQKLFHSYPSVKEVQITGIDPSKNYLLECYQYSRRVYKVVADLKDHIIYSQGLSVWYKVGDLSRRLIVNPHGLEPYQGLTLKDKITGIPFRYIFGRIFSKATKVVSLGGKLTNILSSVTSASKITVLPNAVNLPENILPGYKVDDGKIVFLFVARFAANKGIHILLQAIKELNEQGFNPLVHFNLAGTGPLLNHYKENYQFSNVSYLGFIDDDSLKQLYKEADAFVFPTLFEGMPTVVLEAMSYSLPVIVSDVGATAELVDAANGFLIEAGNVDQVKEAIQSFCNMSQEERTLLGTRSFEKVKNNFTWQAVAKKHISLFRELELAAF